jgi:hypothetical protein
VPRDELVWLVGVDGVVSLDALMSQHGNDTSDIEELRGQVKNAPLVRMDAMTIVLAPGALLAAARNRVVALAQHNGCVRELAEEYRRAVQAVAERSLRLLGGVVLDVGLPQTRVPVRESVVALDSELLCHVMVVTDDLADYDPREAEAVWQHPRLGHQLARRMRGVRSRLRSQTDQSLKVLHLVVHDSLGRASFFLFGSEVSGEGTSFVALRSTELEVLSRLDNFDALGLWKFARADDRLRRSVRVQAFNTLDIFYIYWQRRRSFYINDKKRPNALLLDPATARPLRLDDARRFDPHAALIPGRGYAEVLRRYPGTDIPVYVTRPFAGPIRYVVEGFGLPVWVVPDSSGEGATWQRAMFHEAVAYWLWQLGSVDRPLLERHVAPVVIRVSVAAPAEELAGPPPNCPVG